MATPGYPDPISALNAVAACLAMPNVVIHTGSLDSGLTIPCCASGCEGDCPHGVLRVETGDTLPKDSETASVRVSGKCAHPLVQEIVVNYRECFPSNLGKAATPTPQLTAAGTSIVMSWWDALLRLWACDSPTQKRLRFLSRSDSPPEGQCAGWTLRLECDLVNCLPTTVEVPTSDPQTVTLGMAGETNQTI